MMASIINFILFIVFIYLLIYGIYLLTINLKALFSANKFLEENALENYSEEVKNNKLCVIIFANSKTKKLEPLLNSLCEQTYKKENYSVHVIFAKDSNSLLYTPDTIAGAQIHCIENAEFFKKNKALNLFLEKLIQANKFDAYVFLGADRRVGENYLENVNISLNKNPSTLLVGETVVLPEFKNHQLRAKVIEAKQEFKNNTVNLSRRMFDLASVIDSDNCVIPSEILEKTGRICFESREDELKYSLFLASNGIKPLYSPYIKAYAEAENFNPATANFEVRFALFNYYFKLLYKKPWYFIEFVLSMLQPNVAVILLLYFALLYSSFNFISSIGIKYILHLGVFYLVVWSIGLVASKLNVKKGLMFLLYPFYSFVFNFKKITQDISRKALQRAISEEKNIKSATKEAIITDGVRNAMCKMDLISDNGMRRVILRFKKKRILSDESIRMCDAVENISKKVKAHGYTLKICQNCARFTVIQDETVDLLKGECLANQQSEPCSKFETLIWNTCNQFLPKQDMNNLEDKIQD